MICPYCNVAITPNSDFQHQALISLPQLGICEVKSSIYACPHCNNTLLIKNITDAKNYQYIDVLPKPAFKQQIFSKQISTISPDFVDIYNQAYYAEINNLDKIAGLGYRKSLEFLIKDYIIYQYPELSDKVKNMNLSDCIKNYINDEKFKTTALASAWLGNDETHYVRKHTYYNINDLKELLHATILYLDLESKYIKAKMLTNSK